MGRAQGGHVTDLPAILGPLGLQSLALLQHLAQALLGLGLVVHRAGGLVVVLH
jgi:hypothetical protein